MRRILLLVSVALLALAAPASAAPLVLEGDACVAAGTLAEVMEDPSGTWTIADVQRPDIAAGFRPDESGVLHMGLTTKPHWVRLTVVAPAERDASRDHYVDVRAYLDSLDVFLPDPKAPGGFRQEHLGFWDSHGIDKLASVRLPPLAPGVPVTVYLRLYSSWHIFAAVSVCTREASLREHQSRVFWTGCTLALLLAMFLLFLHMFVHMGERAYLYFALFELASAFFVASNGGLLDRMLRDLAPEWLTYVVVFAIGHLAFWATAFGRTFLHTARFLPRLDVALRVYMGLAALLALATPFFAPQTLNPLLTALALLAPVVTLVPGILRLREGFRPARYYLAAWSLFALASLMSALHESLAVYSFEAMQVGLATNALLLAAGIVHRMRMMRTESETLARAKDEVESALRASEEKYRTIFENAQVALFRIDTRTGRMREANLAMARAYGYDSREEFVATFDMRHAWVDPAERERMYASFGAGTSVDNFEGAFRKKDGSVGWFRFSAQLFAEQGFMEGVGYEVSEERRAREELVRSERKFRSLANATRAMILMIDADRRNVLYANPMALEATGYSMAELSALPPSVLVHPDDRAIVEEMQRPEGAERARAGFTLRYRTKGGEVRWMEATGAAVELEGGGRGWIATAFDVTARRSAEQQMLRADKMAALGMIIAGVAHEINNPNNFIYFNLPILRQYLDAIRPYLDRAAEEEPGLTVLGMPYEAFLEDVYTLLDDMEHGSKRITGIVSELKNYVRSHEVEERRPESVQAVVDHVMALVGKQVRKTVRRFDVEVAPDLPPVLMNAGRIEQALINLVINAGQAADKEDSFIRLTARRKPDAPEAVELIVEDNGVGIPDDILARIFDPFFTTKGREAGTGLGLGIAERIVEEHGGRITVASTLGEGARFTVELPAGSPP